MKNLAIAIFAVFTMAVNAQNRAIEFRHLTWAETLEAAKTENKPIFVDCYTDWCGPCKWMSANIFTKDEVADYYNENYICVKFNMEKGEGRDLAKQFNIRAYPTLVYTNANEEILLVSVGADQDPQSYIDNGKRAKDEKDNLPYYANNKEANFANSAFMAKYFDIMSAANKVDQEEVNAYFAQFEAKEWATKENWGIIQQTVRSADNDVFKSVVANDEIYIEKYGAEAEDFIANIYFYDLANMFYRAKTDEQKEAYTQRKREVINTPFSGKDKVEFKINSFEYERGKNWDAYSQLNIANAEKFYGKDANQLNSIAWNIFENTDNQEYLKAALAMAKTATELEPSSHAILDTYANLLFVTGNKQEALNAETTALDLAKAEGAKTKSYEELISKINESL